jgi:hypothetical protein
VERISGPRMVSVPGNFSKGSTASFTAIWVGTISWVTPKSTKVFPDITCTASLARGRPVAFDTKGTVREARGLASKM